MFFTGWMILFANVGSVAGVTVFFFNNLQTDLEESLYALFQISASYCVIYMFIVGLTLRQKIKEIFENLAELNGTCKKINRFLSTMVVPFNLVIC